MGRIMKAFSIYILKYKQSLIKFVIASLNMYRPGQPKWDSHSTMRVSFRLPRSVLDRLFYSEPHNDRPPTSVIDSVWYSIANCKLAVFLYHHLSKTFKIAFFVQKPLFNAHKTAKNRQKTATWWIGSWQFKKMSIGDYSKSSIIKNLKNHYFCSKIAI